MFRLQLYNSLSNSLEDFIPLDAEHIRMYACGPTVYASPHIGNARPLVIFDILFRLLKRLYPRVTYVRNITDVDDKINAKAKEWQVSIETLATEVTEEFHKSTALMGVQPVTHEPRATQHIAEMLDIIQRLLDNGFAYEIHGHVIFRVRKMPNYGMLSKRNLNDMIAGSRVEIAPYKEDPLDFILWKPSDEGNPAWDSQFGRGRPGWHIECSAMSHKYLGEQFDIHAGGQDLMFPHHENELAQNFGAFGSLMARYWIHNGMLLVDGQKMSKSLGNIIALDDALRRLDGEIIRHVLLSTHFQKTLNWTDALVTHATQSLNRLYGALKLGSNGFPYRDVSWECENDKSLGCQGQVTRVLCGNLNTPLALKVLHDIADKIYKSNDQKEVNGLCRLLQREAEPLGLLSKPSINWFQRSHISREDIEALISERSLAKSMKNYLLADEIRQKLLEKNIQIEDTTSGTVWRSTDQFD